MKKYFKPFRILFSLVFILRFVALSSQTVVYKDAKEFTLVGKAQNTPDHYFRIDLSEKCTLPDNIKNLYKNCAGLAVCFKTNSRQIAAKWTTGNRPTLSNMTAISVRGVDIYIKKEGNWVFAGVGLPNTGTGVYSYTLCKNMDNSEKECMIYLPLYDVVNKFEIGVEEGSTLAPAESGFSKKVVIYGASTTQGTSACRPGMAYPARLSRETGINFINLGTTDVARLELSMAESLAEIKNVDAFVLDCMYNPNTTQITERTIPFVKKIREKHPAVPIIFIQSVMKESGYFNKPVMDWVNGLNKAIKVEVDKINAQGDKMVFLIEEDNFLGDDHEASTDGTHPSDVGFTRLINKIKPQLLNYIQIGTEIESSQNNNPINIRFNNMSAEIDIPEELIGNEISFSIYSPSGALIHNHKETAVNNRCIVKLPEYSGLGLIYIKCGKFSYSTKKAFLN